MNLQVRNSLVLLFIATFVIAVAACNALNGVRGDGNAVAGPMKLQCDPPLDGDEDSRP